MPNVVSLDSIQYNGSYFEVGLCVQFGLEWNREKQCFTLPIAFWNLGPQNELRVGKYSIIRLHST